MSIDWRALLLVAAVALVTTVVVVTLAALAARWLNAGHTKRDAGQNGTALLISGYASLGMVALIVLFGLWLLIPYFH